ncbi:MAG: hypothetical protein AAGC96_09720 [Pseudomonadota bacterium]
MTDATEHVAESYGISPLFCALVGGIGGLAAICTKYLGQDHQFVVSALAVDNTDAVVTMLIGYAIIGPILIFLGAVFGWASGEQNRIKLLALGISAPALVTTYAGGQSMLDTRATAEIRSIEAGPSHLTETSSPLRHLTPVTPVYAGVITSGLSLAPKHESTGDVHAISGVKDSVKLFFGVGKQQALQSHYRVIAGFHSNRQAAVNQAKRINAEDASMAAFVGARADGNPNYPVVLVGESLPRDDANRLRTEAMKLNSINQAYVSASPR